MNPRTVIAEGGCFRGGITEHGDGEDKVDMKMSKISTMMLGCRLLDSWRFDLSAQDSGTSKCGGGRRNGTPKVPSVSRKIEVLPVIRSSLITFAMKSSSALGYLL